MWSAGSATQHHDSPPLACDDVRVGAAALLHTAGAGAESSRHGGRRELVGPLVGGSAAGAVGSGAEVFAGTGHRRSRVCFE